MSVLGKEIGSSISFSLIALTVISGWSLGWTPFLPNAHGQGPATVAVSPSSIASLHDSPGTTVTFQFDTSNAAPFAGFAVAFFYNISVLQFRALDYSNNVLDAPGYPATVLSECLNGVDVPSSGNFCQSDIAVDGVGVVSLELISTTDPRNTTTPDGKLFSVTFTVAAFGFSPIHLAKERLAAEPNAFTPIPVTASDGYFTNMDCPSGSGVLCLPPVVSLVAPQTAVLGTRVTFDGSASKSQNQNGVITQYFWAWRNGLNIAHQTTTSPTSTHVFGNIGTWTVTLTVDDNYGAVAIETLPINVTRNGPMVSASVFFTDSSFSPLPSTVKVALVNGVVRNMSPRVILAWANVTNSGPTPLQSLKLVMSLPSTDWEISPFWMPSRAAVHFYFANASSLGANPEITQPSSILVDKVNKLVLLSIPNFNETGVGHPLLPGQGLLLSVRLSYSLIGTSQPASSYPRGYEVVASAIAYTQSGFSGDFAASSSLVGGFRVTAITRGNDRPHSPVIV